MSLPTKPYRILVFTQARSNSHLLMKLLGSHPSAATKYYPFILAARLGPERLINAPDGWLGTTDEQHIACTFQAEYDKLLDFIAIAEKENKTPLIKEAIPFIIKPQLDRCNPVTQKRSNPTITAKSASLSVLDPAVPSPTMLPDAFLGSIAPVITIRHPAKTIPSLIRAREKAGGTKPTDPAWYPSVSYDYARLLFDYLNTYYHKTPNSVTSTPWPIVIDGDDLVRDTEGVMARFSKAVEWDPELIQYTWEPHSHTLRDQFPGGAAVDSFLETIRASSGVIRNEESMRVPIIAVEAEKWEEEFGKETASIMKDAAEKTLVDYEYLKSFCL